MSSSLLCYGAITVAQYAWQSYIKYLTRHADAVARGTDTMLTPKVAAMPSSILMSVLSGPTNTGAM